MKVIIDPGHGGFDPGGGSNVLWKEKDLTLKISKYIDNRLKALGITSVLTRDTDEFLPPNVRINRINELANDEYAIMISNHINSGGSSGAEVIYSIRNDNKLPRLIAREFENRGHNIHNVYTRTNYAGKDYFLIIRGSNDNIEPIMIEFGFADNPEDVQLLLNNWSNLSEGVVKAIAEYIGVNYQTPTLTIHRIKEGDSLYKIARLYNTTVERLKTDNNLISNNLTIGHDIVIYQ